MLRTALVVLFIGLHAMNMAAAVKVEKTEYKDWANCYRVSNGEIEVVVTGDMGPRIIRFGFVGGQNLLKEFPDQLGRSGEETFQLRGGDRVWKAPEDPVATWAPDNAPVEVRVTPTGLIAREPIEPLTNLQKEIEISMAPSGTRVTVSQRITNKSLFALEFALWALTIMGQGGTAVTGFPPPIIHMSSIGWVIPSTNQVVYVTSKAAIVGMTRTLAHELGSANVRVNCIMPGAILTERQQRFVAHRGIQN